MVTCRGDVLWWLGETDEAVRYQERVLRPCAMPGCYANFMMDEGPEAARACYGSNADRLAALNGRYDPTNVFRRTQNICPGAVARPRAVPTSLTLPRF